MTDESLYQELAKALLRMANIAFPRTMTDVVLWETRYGVRLAFVGDAQKVAKLFGLAGVDSQPVSGVGRRIANAIDAGMGIRLEAYDRRAWDEPMYLSEMLDRLSGQTSWQWAKAHGFSMPDDGVRIGFIAAPGYPWPAEAGYWSAADGDWSDSERPAWLVQVPLRMEPGKMVWGIDPCAVFQPEETKTSPDGPVCGLLDGNPVMVTHSTSLLTAEHGGYKRIEAAVAGIRRCGGLLFPSMAVGPIPATNFGPVVMVAHLELLLDSLKPYRTGARRPCWVYGTDAWTHSTGAVDAMARSLFEELHGDAEWIQQNIDVLGLPPTSKMPDDWVDPLDTTQQLSRSLDERMKHWTRDLSREKFSVDREGHDRYAYCEAKGREVVRLEEFPFIIAPKTMRSAVDAFVDGVGYGGDVVLLPAPRGLSIDGSKEDGHARFQWAWTVSDAVQKLRPMERIR